MIGLLYNSSLASAMPSVLCYNKPATEEVQKSIAGAPRAPDLDASDAFATFVGKLGFRASFQRWRQGRQIQAHWRKCDAFDIYSIQSAADPEPGDVVEILKLAAWFFAPSGPANQRRCIALQADCD